MNDTRITSYATGELTAPEREGFEKELAENPHLAAEMQELSDLCAKLEGLAPVEARFTQAERNALLDRCTANLKVSRRSVFIRRAVAATALGGLAACLLLAPFSPLTVYFGHRGTQGAGGTPQTGAGEIAATRGLPTAVLGGKSPSELISEGEGLYSVGRFDLAVKRFEEVLAVDADNPAARHGLDKVQETKSQFQASGVTEPPPFMASLDLAVSVPGAHPQIVMGPPLSSASGFAGVPVDGRTSGTAAASISTGNAAPPRELAKVKEFTMGWGKGTGRREAVAENSAGQRPARGDKFNTEAYDAGEPGRFLQATTNPLSTFSVDVDTASYAIARRFIGQGSLPPAGAVRVEEFINYFPYDLPQPADGEAFSVTVDAAAAPWNAAHQLVRVALRGKDLPAIRPQANLVFLIDVSGSMRPDNKLPLLKTSLEALLAKLGERDRVAIVVYAGASGLVLPSTSDKEKVRAALQKLESGGSTNGGEGIRLAYATAGEHFIEGGNNRVILCTDGDFNVGTTNQSELVSLIEKERASGVFLSVLGFGEGNLKDSTMEKLADKGNGNYSYIDSEREGRKVLVQQMAGTLFTIAKDVKLQVEFNPAQVAGYRLIGYENRTLAKEDFNDDKKDAGEIGAGHTVTAFYEVVPAGAQVPGERTVDPLKYQQSPLATEAPVSGDLLTVKLRTKAPDGETSALIERSLPANSGRSLDQMPDSFRFAAAAAAFAMKLRDNPHFAMEWDAILKLGRGALADDPGGYRAELLTLVEKSKDLR